MIAKGTVQRWHDEEGWGVLVSPEVAGTVFAHFSHIQQATGYRSLTAGQNVEFDYATPGQDGCDHSVLWVRAV
jgi:CspA family cold shock protein